MSRGIYEVEIEVIEARGNCAAEYKPGDKFRIKGFYIDPRECNARICIHTLTAMRSLLSPFIHRVSAKLLGTGDRIENMNGGVSLVAVKDMPRKG